MNRSHSANSGFAPRSPFAGSIARTRAASAASAPEKPVGIASAHPDHPVPDRRRKQHRKFRLFSTPRTRTTTPLTPGGGRDHSLVSEKNPNIEKHPTECKNSKSAKCIISNYFKLGVPTVFRPVNSLSPPPPSWSLLLLTLLFPRIFWWRNIYKMLQGSCHATSHTFKKILLEIKAPDTSNLIKYSQWETSTSLRHILDFVYMPWFSWSSGRKVEKVTLIYIYRD